MSRHNAPYDASMYSNGQWDPEYYHDNTNSSLHPEFADDEEFDQSYLQPPPGNNPYPPSGEYYAPPRQSYNGMDLQYQDNSSRSAGYGPTYENRYDQRTPIRDPPTSTFPPQSYYY